MNEIRKNTMGHETKSYIVFEASHLHTEWDDLAEVIYIKDRAVELSQSTKITKKHIQDTFLVFGKKLKHNVRSFMDFEAELQQYIDSHGLQSGSNLTNENLHGNGSFISPEAIGASRQPERRVGRQIIFPGRRG